MDVIIHIGKQKTGSTSIQHRLREIRDRLAERGILYSEAFGDGKAKLITDFFAPRGKKNVDRGAVSTAFDEELKKQPWKTVILSNENLFHVTPEAIRAMHKMVTDTGGKPIIYGYVRRLDEDVVSLYQQRVRTGGLTQSLDAFAKAMGRQSYYRYKARLDAWASVFGREAMNVRLFHRDSIKDSPFDDFMSWTGLPSEDWDFSGLRARSANESYDPIGVDVLRYLHRFQNDNPEALGDRFIEEVRRDLRALNSEERLRLSQEQAEQLMNAFRADSEALVAEYLTPKEGDIFLAPPAAGETVGEADAYDVVARALNVIPDLDAAIGDPPGTRVPRSAKNAPPAKVDPATRALLIILERYREAHPDRLSAATVQSARRRLQALGPSLLKTVRGDLVKAPKLPTKAAKKQAKKGAKRVAKGLPAVSPKAALAADAQIDPYAIFGRLLVLRHEAPPPKQKPKRGIVGRVKSLFRKLTGGKRKDDASGKPVSRRQGPRARSQQT